MGDVAAAKRNMKWVQMAVEDNRFDQLDGRIEKVEGDLEGLSDADKAPFLAELAEYRRAGQVAVAKEKAKRTEEAIARNISGGSVTRR